MHCKKYHKPLNRLTMQLVITSEHCEPEVVYFDDRLCEPRQIKYNPIPKVRELARRFAQ